MTAHTKSEPCRILYCEECAAEIARTVAEPERLPATHYAAPIEDYELRQQLFQVAFNTNGQDFHESTYRELVQLIAVHTAQARSDERKRTVEDIKRAGYGYDDGSGFVLKISYAELAEVSARQPSDGKHL